MPHKYYLGARAQIAAMVIAKKFPEWINRSHPRAKLALLVFSILGVAFVIQGIAMSAVHLRPTSDEALQNSSSISMVGSHTFIPSASIGSTLGPPLDTKLMSPTTAGPGSDSSTKPLQTTFTTSTLTVDSWTTFGNPTLHRTLGKPLIYGWPLPHQPVVTSRVGSPIKILATCTEMASELPTMEN